MKVLGYSERGIINALFYEIAYSENPDDLFHKLISRASFPLSDSRPSHGSIELLIEQSFSDFGDADVVALISEEADRKSAIFIEAKVKTFQTVDWKIENQLNSFYKGLRRRMNSSNLFAQLYHKFRLVHALTNVGVAGLHRGIPFEPWSSKQTRKIGNNGVVEEATSRLLPFIRNSFFLALVPDSRDRMASFFESTLRSQHFPDVAEWNDVSGLGYLTFADVEAFCRDESLHRTLEVFLFNKGQIYATHDH